MPVRVLTRCPDRLPVEYRDRVETVAGNVHDREAMVRAVRGAQVVLNLAGCTRAWSPDPSEYAAVNVQAVEFLLGAAADTGVERLVHVSTILALPPFRPARVRGDAARLTPYEATKRNGEALVAAYAALGGHAVIVRPTRVYGPGPLNEANSVTRMIALYLQGRFRLRPADRGVLANYVHAEDVARGIILASRHGTAGACYALGGENASLQQLLELAGELSGVRRHTFALPQSAALAVARGAEWWGRLGGSAPMTRRWVRTFLEDRRVDVTPTCRALDYHPRPLREGLKETIQWLRRSSPIAA
jgi:farnesol dehydrogenase